ncbi:ThuA domain-containing protein [Chitinophaga pinensis]|uniref:PKD domain containing protein n=1 Tax=Chitinophaga pinensis (strain ATCC 43595 / DSM 2588 / LMG 13176 / NBRC 15968 / NCIMB 11800 / UQM 2034) TaxID=485918 RepID=A0A979G6N6_CHIPD|nr:ThuA domain-containing protein [Chitinophaga pinensis]ACU61844.1 PKD domain containing protein [Chitinophaga pinensis DSM 2588]
MVRRDLWTFMLLSVIGTFGTIYANAQTLRVLVFSKTEGFRHSSIEPGKAAFSKMAAEKNFAVDFTEDASFFNTAVLKRYSAVVFLSTTGDVLNDAQQQEFERYIQAGGGFVGIHAATDCEYDWPWYGRLVGAWFLDHPMPNNVQKGKYYVTAKNSFATKEMPDTFQRMDEFYSFKQIDPGIHPLIKIDEKSYTGGKNGDNHPMSWYHDFDGGRSFYTNMGHTDETFKEDLFLKHLYAGLQYAMSAGKPVTLDYSKAKPEENRFTKVILAEKLNEPMEISVLNDGRILFVERHGAVKLYNIKTKQLKTIATIPVSTKYKDKEGKESEAEDGLLGLNKDPDFASNHWIYLYYSDPAKPQNILTRYTLNGDILDLKSRKVLLEIPTQREQCCHTGGSIDWDGKGNLYLSTGDNTSPRATTYAPIDERAARSPWDAQKSSANTNDLRGKIIRIKPQPDGSYTIPEGNLFPKGTAKTRPEIYIMGDRNPFRLAVDKKSGFLYWGEIGPDASDDSLKGPAGQDEINQAKKPGNYGWPYFVGDNIAYPRVDFTNEQVGGKFDPSKPINTSPNNTGLNELPPAEKAFIWYPYGVSKEFPLLGSGGRSAMAGPVFYSDDFKKAQRAFPDYYDGKLLIYEWMRGWIMAVTLDKDANYVSMERVMPSYKFSNPMDMEFAANGDLYMLEYGSGWFSANDDARLIRIEYNSGNRQPMIRMSTDKPGGAIPLTVNLSAAGTSDPDGDTLKYVWKVTSKNGYTKTIAGQDAALTFAKPGLYKASLTVSDGKGSTAVQSIELTAGNEAPDVRIDIGSNNKSFFKVDKTYTYKVDVKDKEDGSLSAGKIKAADIAVNIDYVMPGQDNQPPATGHKTAPVSSTNTKGLKLLTASDCRACHTDYKKSIGPAYFAVSKKYQGNNSILEKLVKKTITGGKGVWGDVAMPAHPQLSADDAAEMIKYILDLSKPKTTVKSLPVTGTYAAKLPAGEKGAGLFVFNATYTDKGSNGLPGITSVDSITLRNPSINPTKYDIVKDATKMSFSGNSFIIPVQSGSYIGLNHIDLTGITAIDFMAMAPKAQINAAGGIIELHIDTPDGKLLGQTPFIGDAPGGAMFGGKPTQLSVTPTNGFHDIYLVFRNKDAAPGSSLMIVLNTTFRMAD